MLFSVFRNGEIFELRWPGVRSVVMIWPDLTSARRRFEGCGVGVLTKREQGNATSRAATTNNNGVTVFRNANGQRTGSTVQQGDLTIFYNANGQRTGTSTS